MQPPDAVPSSKDTAPQHQGPRLRVGSRRFQIVAAAAILAVLGGASLISYRQHAPSPFTPMSTPLSWPWWFQSLEQNAALRSAPLLLSIFGTSDGSQLWAVGDNVLHYGAQTGRWEPQTSGTTGFLTSIFGTSDGSQLWAVGDNGTILHYSAQTKAQTQTGGWEPQTSGTPNALWSIFGTSDGSQLWAVGKKGTILHYSAETGRWEPQGSGTPNALRSIFGTSDGSQLWTVGEKGTILHYGAQTGRWEPQTSGTPNGLWSIFGTSDGSQLWVVGGKGTILHSKGGTLWEGATSYRRWPAPWFLLVLLVCVGGLVWATRPLVTAVPVEYIEDMANADSPVNQLKNDALGYKPLVTRLLRFIQNPKTKPPLVLAIQAPWGMGKSSVMEMLRTELNDKRAAVTVWFNAWHHQKEDQLLAYLLEAIQKQVSPSWFSAVGLEFRFDLLRVRMFSSPERFLTVLAALVLLVFHRAVAVWLASLLALTDSTSRQFTWPVAGVALLLLANQVRAFSADPQKLVEDSTRSLWKTLRDLFVFPSLQGKTDVRQEFANNLKEVTDALLPQRLVIFLDDLDRCRPEQVVQILEAINFLSSAAPCFIVVGADYRKVETLAGQHFETIALQEAQNVALDTSNVAGQPSTVAARLEYAKQYMRKIVNIRLDLPEPRPEGYANLIRQVGEAGTNMIMKLQRAVVGLVLLLFVALSIAVAAGWLRLSSGESPTVQVTTFVPRSIGAQVGPITGTGTASQADPRRQQGVTPATPAGAEASGNMPDSEATAVLWNHRLTIAVLLLIALIFLVRVRSRPKEMEKAVDSKNFSDALNKMASSIKDRCGTPREVRRFQNYLRFLAASDDSETRSRIENRSGDLVKLAATGTKTPTGKVRSDVDREVIDFYSHQCEMLGLDPETFQPIEEHNIRERAASASA